MGARRLSRSASGGPPEPRARRRRPRRQRAGLPPFGRVQEVALGQEREAAPPAPRAPGRRWALERARPEPDNRARDRLVAVADAVSGYLTLVGLLAQERGDLGLPTRSATAIGHRAGRPPRAPG